MKNSLIQFSLYSLFVLPSIITALVLIGLFLVFCFDNTLFNFKLPKSDSFLIVVGNFLIAYYIAQIINKKHKNEELKIHSCFNEIDQLLKLIKDLKKAIKKNKIKDDDSTRFMTLILLQIDLISNYKFVKNVHTDKLMEYYNKLDNTITGTDTVLEEYQFYLLQIEKKVLVIKSDIL